MAKTHATEHMIGELKLKVTVDKCYCIRVASPLDDTVSLRV